MMKSPIFPRFVVAWPMFLFVPGLLFAQGLEPCLCEDWQNKHPDWIWCDDFEDSIPLNQKYFEYDSDDGDFIVEEGVGVNQSRALRARFQTGEVSAGSLKKSFGRTPDDYIGRHAASPNEDFQEMYWRLDLRRQQGWIGGGGAKLCRAICFTGPGWAQGMIAHLWSGGAQDRFLLMDPASGITANGELVSTKYNDFANLRWLGNKAGTTPLFSDEHADEWFCIEAHAKLNTPGKADGVFEFWINGQLQASHRALNWHGDWNQNPERFKINALFISNYWNAGSPREQERYVDNIVISRTRIGCDCGDENQERADVDLDAIPDDVESRIPGLTVGMDDQGIDDDLDGMTNAAEYWAGTDLDDPTSKLEIRSWLPTDTELALSFLAAFDRRYTIEKCEDLMALDWRVDETSHIEGSGADRVVRIPLSEPSRFYRIRLNGFVSDIH